MNLETPVGRFKYSRHIAYLLSLLMLALILLNWLDLDMAFWPIVILFIFTLIFNGGIGGSKITDRLPFYLSLIGFILFVALVFLSMAR